MVITHLHNFPDTLAERIDRGVPNVEPGASDSFVTFGVAWAQVSNTPFRNHKIYTYEGGISSPFIARWRRRIQPGSFNRQSAHVMDVMATVLDAAGGRYPASYKNRKLMPLEGKSLVLAFEGKSAPYIKPCSGNMKATAPSNKASGS